MKMTFRSFVIVALMFSVSEVKCGEVNVEIKELDSIKDKAMKKVSLLITHSPVTDKIIKKSSDFESFMFTCLEQNQSLELDIHAEKPDEFQVIVNKSFDFGPFEVHYPQDTILNFSENDKVCFFNGYFVRLHSDNKDKAELFLNFMTEKTEFVKEQFLSFYTSIDKKIIFTNLQSIADTNPPSFVDERDK